MTFIVNEAKRAPWTGDLPFGIDRAANSESLRSRFGAPEESNETLRMWVEEPSP